jgi:DNA-directed RNA polymerase subunit RPC12/RpoP
MDEGVMEWTCPKCGERNSTTISTPDVPMQDGVKGISTCMRCGAQYGWMQTLTPEPSGPEQIQ